MRKYEKPVMQVERYEAKNAVATGCYLQDTTVVGKQTVDCIINGRETIFNTASGCSTSGTYTGKDTTKYSAIGQYNGQMYYVWYNGSVPGQPSDTATAELNKILSAVYGVEKSNWGSGYHAGKVTALQISKMNSTS